MKVTQNALRNDEVRWAIEARQKWELDRLTELNVAVEKGKAEGKAELAKQMAQKLRALGQSDDVIYEVTGLRPEEL